VKLAEGFEGISIFTTDNASDTVLENYIYVVSDILPYAVDLIMSIKKSKSSGNQSGKRSCVLPTL
jgi:hypothetical protein